MASHWFSTDLQQEVSCPICLDILQDPVTIDCGHNFCHGCITQLRKTSENFLQCPICKSSMRKDTFSPNWLLGNLVERIQAINFSERWSEEEELRCPKHGEKLHYFCEEDGELLCVVCHDSKDHKSHNTRVIEEAAQHHQEQIQLHMGVLQQKKQLYSNDQDEEKISTFVAQVKFEKQRIQTEFKHLQQVLEEEKNVLLSSIEWLEKEGIKECENYSAVTQAQFSSLKDSLTSKQQMPPRQLPQVSPCGAESPHGKAQPGVWPSTQHLSESPSLPEPPCL
ncbi:E3 ubiquitin-protein ligase TRIM31-like isoform X1 [Ochotona princeps]|uniref:E3 ubiquitin-protein ligase TRIM31-like isoform X1 n=1 Tax=Ochotona princeps TaxID=9978 RepID=UPI00271455DF|nr:E3 ubiquitin-protein ligase TRIM31-like isoform X1 [Ochotona princeps]